MKRTTTYSYPSLSNRDYGYVRIGGPGLANCMFFAAKAYVDAIVNDRKMIAPTWRKFSIGPILRRERDKRVYNHLFSNNGQITGLKKLLILCFCKNRLQTFGSLGNYFLDLAPHHADVVAYFRSITINSTIQNVDAVYLADKVAIHVRLGDYSQDARIPLEWYRNIINSILSINPSQKFVLFSDGLDDELKLLMDIASVERKFYGNAFADMYAISHCKLLLASDSTFSAWGAFLGKVPILFSKRHFPSVYSGIAPEYVLGDTDRLPDEIATLIQ